MESNYKNYLTREKAIRAKKNALKNAQKQYFDERMQELESSVAMAQVQATDDSPDTEQRPKESKENYYRRRRITEIREGGDTPPSDEQTGKQSSNYIKNYRIGSSDQIPANTRQQEEDPKKRAADEIRRQEIEKIKAETRQRAAQAARRTTQRAAQATAEAASRLSGIAMQGLRQAAVWIGGTALGAITGTGCFTIIVILIAVVLIIAAADQACNSSMSTAISAGIPLFGLIKWWICN